LVLSSSQSTENINETKFTRLEKTWQPEMEVAQKENAPTKASTENAEEVIQLTGGIG